MQLLYFKENAVDLLKKADLSVNAKFYLEDNSWLERKYNNQKLLLPFSKVEVNDFSLKSGNGVKDDYDNMIIMYENLKFLTDSQASDERLWSGMAHTVFWDYMQNRWPMPSNKDKINSHILNNYFFWNSTKAVFLNGLSRLWWYARFTYDENNFENPYELTKYICENDINGKIFPLLSCVFASNKDVFKNIIKGIKKYEEDNNVKLSRNQFLELKTYLNRLSGKVFIDQLTSEDVYMIIHDKIKDIQDTSGWKNDVKKIINIIPDDEFTLDDVYSFENELQELHPENNHIRDKIRQQLQLIRNDGMIEFLGNGLFRKK